MEKSEKLTFDSKSPVQFRKDKIVKPLSLRKKATLFLIFIIGIFFSFPTVLPVGLICAAILLFQKNKKAVKLGYLLILLQALIVFFYFYLYNIVVT